MAPLQSHSENKNMKEVVRVAITNIQKANFALIAKCLVDGPALIQVAGKMKAIESMQQQIVDMQC